MLRRNIYKWHRITSLIIAIPLVLWAASGFMHPIMTTIRPKVGTQWLPPQPIDSSKIKIPLQQALQQNNITVIENFRIVQMAGNYFYQLQISGNKVLRYISTQTGKQLNNGDELYARQLAKQFLQGIKKPDKQLLASLNTTIITAKETDAAVITEHDCCFNATAAIMNDTAGSKITAVTFVESFNSEYKSINRLLPAYKVNFERADGMRIYVETAQDRFAFAMDDKRAVFDKFFSLFHTWSWLDFAGKGKLAAEALLCLMAFATTLMGLYIFFITKTKNAAGNGVVKARNNHRWTSLVFSLFTLMFTGSGAFHAIDKFAPDDRYELFVTNQFAVNSIDFDYKKLTAVLPDKLITNVSMVKIGDSIFWQVFTKKPENSFTTAEMPKGDLMKDKSVPPPATVYIYTATNNILENGERKFAAYLASVMSRHAVTDTAAVTVITKFAGEYGFVNKRLPVWKVSYPFNNRQRWYVETSTGKLAAKINDNDLIEGYSFAMLHKHHFMDFAGKEWRDFSTMFWAMAQIVMVAVGLVLYFKIRKRKKREIA